MREQLLAANHFLMGTTNIVLLPLPSGWRIFDSGPTGPEVDQWTETAECRWMSEGYARYNLVRPHPEQPGLVRTEIELTIRARPAAAPPPPGPRFAAGANTGTVMLNGHAAAYSVGTVRRGLVPRREVPALHLLLTCPETARHLQLEMTAGYREGLPSATQADLLEVLETLASGFRCH